MSPKTDYRFGYRCFTVGLTAQLTDASNTDIFEMSYGDQDVVGFAYNSTGTRKRPVSSNESLTTKNMIVPAAGKHPIPGVDRATVRHKGINDVIEVEVTWKCYNQVQLEFMREHFMTAGTTVVLEYGQYETGVSDLKTFNWSSTEAIGKLAKLIRSGREKIIQEYVIPNRGNYNLVAGQVVNSNITYGDDGTYTCVTKFYSVGESVMGINNRNLLVDPITIYAENKGDEAAILVTKDTTDSRKIVDEIQGAKEEAKKAALLTIHDFFKPTSGFDALLAANINNKNFIRQAVSSEERQPHWKMYDYTMFISWGFFLDYVIPSIFSVIPSNVGDSGVEIFKNINRMIEDNGNKKLVEPLVGNHKFLRTTDPETMIIINKRSQELDKKGNKIFVDVPYFGSLDRKDAEANGLSPDIQEELGSSNLKYGMLRYGVWLNVEEIRNAFLSNNTFINSFTQILRSMCNAVESYWDLRLSYDENLRCLKVIDSNLIVQETKSPDPDEDADSDSPFADAYIFNEKTYSELLSLNFDASYTDELLAIVMLSRKTHDQDGKAITGDAPEARSVAGQSQWPNQLNRSSVEPTLDKELDRLADEEKRVSEYANRDLASSLTPRVNTEILMENIQKLQAEEAQSNLTQERTDTNTVLEKFKNTLDYYVAWPSILRYGLGLDRGTSAEGSINSYIAPAPTNITIGMKIRGLAGLRFFDTFLVDKLPQIYELHGVYLINGIADTIGSEGWYTELNGMYYYVWHQPRKKVPARKSVRKLNEI